MQRAVFLFGRALRETAAMMDKIGLAALERPIYQEPCMDCVGGVESRDRWRIGEGKRRACVRDSVIGGFMDV